MYSLAGNLIQRFSGKHGMSGYEGEIRLFAFCVAIVLWLVAHPYSGIYHDSIVYSLLAAHWLAPENYSRDLFFIFGSQDDFSFYTPLFATLVSRLGLDLASRSVVLLGGLLWITAFQLLARAVFRSAWPGIFVVLFSATIAWAYSPNFGTFELNENFATARCLSMPLALMAVAADISGRRAVALAVALLATLLHPLLGFWALVLIVCWRWSETRIGAGALITFSLLVIVPVWFPVSRLALMGPEWSEMVRHSSADVFLGQSDVLRLDRLIYCLAALMIGARRGNEKLRQLYAVMALMTAMLYLLSLICSYYLPVTLLIQAQPWRVMWLAMSLGLVAVVDGLWSVVSLGRRQAMVCCLLLLLVYAFDDYLEWAVLLATLCVLSDGCLKRALAAADWLLKRKFLCCAVIGTMVVALLPKYFVDVDILGIGAKNTDLPLPSLLRGFLFEGGLGIGFILWMLLATNRNLRRAGWIVILPLMASAVTQWDQRSARQMEEESLYLAPGAPRHPFQRFIKPGDVVAWPGNEKSVWFELKAANYATPTQAIGIVFSEEKAREAKQRLERLVLASAGKEGLRSGGGVREPLEIYRSQLIKNGEDPRNIHKYRPTALNPDRLPFLCQQGGIDWAVLERGKERIKLQPVAAYSSRSKTWDLIRCSPNQRNAQKGTDA